MKKDKQRVGRALPGVHKLLDFPEIQIGPVKKPLPHKSIHNTTGLALAYAQYGRDGLVSAANHMLDDIVSEALGKQLKKALRLKHI